MRGSVPLSDRLYLFRFSPLTIELALAAAMLFGSRWWTGAEIGGIRGREIRLRANEASKSRP